MPSNISKMVQNKNADCTIFATINDIIGSKDDFLPGKFIVHQMVNQVF
jgi:hypothetical protein